MDHSSFDRLSRLLGMASSRRAGLLAIAGFTPAAALAGAAHPQGPDAAGQCGPTARDNACVKDSDCCTGYCKPPKTSGGKGRCRCVKQGKKCKKGQTCCGDSTCTNGTCAITVTCSVQPGGACTSDSQCCLGAVCKALPGSAAQVMPGTYCALPTGSPCTPVASQGFPLGPGCVGGWCSPTTSLSSGVCGDFIDVSACTAQTDSCAADDIYFLTAATTACTVSVGGLPGTGGISQNPSAATCTTNADCVAATEGCMDLGTGQCSVLSGLTGKHCVTFTFWCTQSSDCPTKPSLTPTCSQYGNCVYS